MFVSEPDGLLEAHGNLHESEFVWNAIDHLVLHPGLQSDQLQQQTRLVLQLLTEISLGLPQERQLPD